CACMTAPRNPATHAVAMRPRVTFDRMANSSLASSVASMPTRQILTRKSRGQELDLAVAWWSILSKTSSVPHYSFGDIEVDAESRRLTKAGELLPVPDRHFGVLLALLARRGPI